MESPNHQPAQPAESVDRERVLQQLRVWRERLIDLSRGNPLLGINRSRTSKLQISNPPASVLFKKLVVDQSPLQLPVILRRPPPTAAGEPVEDPPYPQSVPNEPPWRVRPGDITFIGEPADIARRMRRIRDNARTTVEERGVTTLHVTFGSLRWTDPLLGLSDAPLILVPCALESTGVDSPLILEATEEEPLLNPALALFLRERYQRSLPVLPEEIDEGTLAALLHDTRATVDVEWTIADAMWLSTFSFETLTMYQDLGTLADAAVANPVVARLAGAVRAQADNPGDDGASELLGDDLDAYLVHDVIPIPVFPTDSSQLEALTYARAGKHLVVHGPPGTGKSQTITTLIADSLGQGKTVLFVSAKMAALEVVHDRLIAAGFGRFCLEAHSTKAGKTRIIDELRSTLDVSTNRTVRGEHADLQRYLDLRTALNQAVMELHQKRQVLGRTIYEGIGQFGLREAFPAVSARLPWSDPLAVTPGQLQQAGDVLTDLKAEAATFSARDSHPWHGCHGADLSFATQESLHQDISDVNEYVSEMARFAAVLELYLPALGQRSLDALLRVTPALSTLAATTWLPMDWAIRPYDEIANLARDLRTASDKTTDLLEARKEFSEQTDSGDPVAAADLLIDGVSNHSPFFKRLLPGYFSWKREIKAAFRPQLDDFGALRTLASLSTRIRDQEAWLTSNEAVLRHCRTQGSSAPSINELNDAATAFIAAQLLREALRDSSLDSPSVSTELVSAKVRDAANRLVQRLASEPAHLAESIARVDHFWPEGFVDLTHLRAASVQGVAQRSDEALANPHRFSEWVRLDDVLSQCRDLGLGEFIDALAPYWAETAPEIFSRRFWLLWTDAQIRQVPSLARFSGGRRVELTAEFARLDQRVRETARDMSLARASIPAEQINAVRSVAAGSQVAILRRELQKKRPRPLRRLFAEIPQVLQAIKPCMLMSPVSVSTYLSPDCFSFDIVVFDEASQIPPQEAIPSILRGRQVIVAGDENQLPPTSFFSSALFADEEEEREDEGMQPLESLLHECEASVPLFQPAHLRWHYRSRDERLIDFSNHAFYDGRLITFPSPGHSPDQGVRLAYVANGVWDRGKSKTNRAEARAVAHIVMEQLERHPERSIGVVAMNISQKEAIEDALSEALELRGDLKSLLADRDHEPFFVKSLENVQGDERDAIIISIGYGPDVAGQVRYNFGPLNQEGGWRRLNVLVTRAKYLCVLVTSLRSDQLRGVAPTNRGATVLRQFVEYAERGGRLSPSEAVYHTQAETNDFEDAVAAALRSAGLVVDEQVGASSYRIDLAVRDPRDLSWYLLGIECDGATYHSSRSARDRDLLRAEILRGMNWRLHRIWSVDWFRNPTEVLASTLRAVERARAQREPEAGVSAPVAGDGDEAAALPMVEWSPDPSEDPIPIGHSPSFLATPVGRVPPTGLKFGPGVPYVRAAQFASDRSLLLDSHRLPSLSDEVVRIVSVEQPIHLGLLLQRLKELHRVARAGRNVEENFRAAVQRAVRTQAIKVDKQEFAWMPNGKIEVWRSPNGRQDIREIAQIPQDELRVIVLHVVESQFGLPRDALARAVAQAVGFQRTSAEVADAIQDIVDALIERGELRLSGFQITLP
ncbi:MAG: DUF3320 domain-containing protein [Chloroflexi bacterium]|nr:DUF3320 domain-containing protein [Chloroflexota bacterium]